MCCVNIYCPCMFRMPCYVISCMAWLINNAGKWVIACMAHVVHLLTSYLDSSYQIIKQINSKRSIFTCHLWASKHRYPKLLPYLACARQFMHALTVDTAKVVAAQHPWNNLLGNLLNHSHWTCMQSQSQMKQNNTGIKISLTLLWHRWVYIIMHICTGASSS